MVLDSYFARANKGPPSFGGAGGGGLGLGTGANSYGPPSSSITPSNQQRVEHPIPGDKVGLVIGRGGETIKSIMARSGARVEVDKNIQPGVVTRICFITGDEAAIEAAKGFINDAIQPMQRDMGMMQGMRVKNNRVGVGGRFRG